MQDHETLGKKKSTNKTNYMTLPVSFAVASGLAQLHLAFHYAKAFSLMDRTMPYIINVVFKEKMPNNLK